ncbi:hypothetical protein [Salinibacterium sp. ZJ450]|uniref:hypothetical protein n=1 Tax=Salinibacterium sp. ZJ450 TaxID=2708338 RepID=UPI001423C54B|nr:hypothetical protein [Salinibacterium sp. ZJ450]
MNSNLAYALPDRHPQPSETPTRRIEVAPTRQQRRARPRTVYALVTIAGVFAILIAQLLISIVLSDGAYQISALQTEQKELGRTAGTLTEQLDVLNSPQHLAASAESLGMVSNANPAFLRLADGAVLGTPTPATAAGGSVIGAGGSLLVANSLLEGVDLAGQGLPGAVAPGTAAPGTPVAAQAPAAGPWITSTPAASSPAAGAPATAPGTGSVASTPTTASAPTTLPAPTTR